MQEYKRTNYVVNRRLQFGMISAFLTAVLAASAVTVLLVVLFLGNAGTAARELFIDMFLVPVLINDVAVMAAVAVAGIFYSNRIAGPLYQIQQVIEDAAAGNRERRIHLRPKDYAQDLADQINLLLDQQQK